MVYFGAGAAAVTTTIPAWTQAQTLNSLTCNYPTVISLSPTDSRITINQEDATSPATPNTLTYDVSTTTSGEVVGPITVTRTATGSTGPVSSSGYEITIQFAPQECQTFTINALSIPN